MLQLSNAKINLGLTVTGKRNDGYHNIASLFLPVALYDAVEIIPASENSLHCYGLPIPGNAEENSCLKTLELLQSKFEVQNYAIHLYKTIPAGAGLGGGSSNAAQIIHLVNKRDKLNLSEQKMMQLALEIGSDNVFFIQNKTSFVSGRGEEIEPCAIDLSGLRVVLIQPNVHMSTAEAYEKVQIADLEFPYRQLNQADLIAGKLQPINAFQSVFLNLYPETRSILTELQKAGAFYASLSGSGSCFYGLFSDEQTDFTQLRKYAQQNNFFYFETSIL